MLHVMLFSRWTLIWSSLCGGAERISDQDLGDKGFGLIWAINSWCVNTHVLVWSRAWPGPHFLLLSNEGVRQSQRTNGSQLTNSNGPLCTATVLGGECRLPNSGNYVFIRSFFKYLPILPKFHSLDIIFIIIYIHHKILFGETSTVWLTLSFKTPPRSLFASPLLRPPFHT